MKRLFPVFMLLLCGIPVVSGEIVRGRVYDSTTGEGLPGAAILAAKDQGTVSGDDGMYSLVVSSGHFTLKCHFLGYHSGTRVVRVNPGDTVQADFALVPEVSEIEQVVVSANRIEQRVSELTVSMSILKPEVVSASHITDAQELINKSPGIEVLDGQASIRGGSGFSYGAGSRVLALIDGLPVLSADAGNVKWNYLPLDNISQVEIIKGASSVAYGSSALNGIINFRTADPAPKPVTRFYAGSSLYGTPATREWKWWNSPRFLHTASFSHLQKFKNTDLAFGSHLMLDNSYRRLNDENLGRVNLKLKHRDPSREGLVYGLALNAGASGKTDFVIWENAATGALRQDESTAIKIRGSFLTLDPFMSFRKGEKQRHDLKTRIQFSDNYYPESSQNNSRGLNLYGEYQYVNQLTEWVNLISGFSGNFTRVVSRFYGNHDGMNSGVYTQAEILPAEGLKLVAGLRLEYNVLDGAGDQLVPLFRAGLNYRVSGYTFLRASFGQGYRYPSVAEKFAATTLGSVKIFPSQQIQPESGWNSEIGIKQGLRAGALQGQLDAALFLSQNKDMIEFLFGIHADPVDGQFGYGFKATNREASRVYGFELEYMLAKTSGRLRYSATGGYVFMVPEEINPVTWKSTGVMLKYRRRHSASMSLMAATGRIEAGTSLYLRSRILSIDDVFLAEETRETILPGFFDYWNTHHTGYFLMDLNAGYAVSPQIKVSVVVKNFTNTEYLGRPGDIQPPRSFSLRLGAEI